MDCHIWNGVVIKQHCSSMECEKNPRVSLLGFLHDCKTCQCKAFLPCNKGLFILRKKKEEAVIKLSMETI